MKKENIRTIIISRTDAIGDVVLTLPLASVIKNIFNGEVKVIFFGKTYTESVINCCSAVDKFLNYDSFKSLDKKSQKQFLKDCKADAIIHIFPRSDIAVAAKRAGINYRIGTTNRLYHWYTCNKLVRLSRKNSELHEAQLNLMLLQPFEKNISRKDAETQRIFYEKIKLFALRTLRIFSANFAIKDNCEAITNTYPLKSIPKYYSFSNKSIIPPEISNQLSNDKFKLVLHPRSNASAREWSIENYASLINLLPENKFQIILTGGNNEKDFLMKWSGSLPSHVLNLAGNLSLEELIALLANVNGIVAASTGPLHIAAALGKHALGIYPPIRPMDPRRWAPVGVKAEYIVVEKSCSDCRRNPAACHCMNEISANMVAGRILKWIG